MSGSFEEYKKRQFKLAQQDKAVCDNFVIDIERAIKRQIELKEKELASKLKTGKLTPRSYSRQREDLVSW